MSVHIRPDKDDLRLTLNAIMPGWSIEWDGREF